MANKSYWRREQGDYSLPSTHNRLERNPKPKNAPDATPQSRAKPGNRSPMFSMTSADLERMVKIKELLNRENELKTKIREKEMNFVDTLRKGVEKMAEKENNFMECLCKTHQHEKKGKASKRIRDSKRLTDYLIDLKREIKKCIARIEGPIADQLQKERYKSVCLEREVQLSKKVATGGGKKADLELNKNLEDVLKNINALTEINVKLKEDLNDMETKYNELQELLAERNSDKARVVQQLSEAANRKVASLAVCGLC